MTTWGDIVEALTTILGILNESAVYMLVGFALAGVLHVVLARHPGVTAPLFRGGARPVFMAALVGLPMPLCSCSVIPTALALRRKGASKGATASFLISVPETDVVSILLTLALLGPVVAVFRPLAALAIAIATGLVLNRLDGTSAAPADAPSSVEDTPTARRGWLAETVRFGFREVFDDVIVQLLIGIAVAGAIAVVFPAARVEEIAGGRLTAYLAMLVAGIPVYVCASASTPIAAGLIAGGISPGAAMVFLLAGPATNIATLLVLDKNLGRRAVIGYLATIAVSGVLCGLVLDAVLGPDFRVAGAGGSVVDGTGPIHWAASAVLLVLAAATVWRKLRAHRKRSSAKTV